MTMTISLLVLKLLLLSRILLLLLLPSLLLQIWLLLITTDGSMIKIVLITYKCRDVRGYTHFHNLKRKLVCMGVPGLKL